MLGENFTGNLIPGRWSAVQIRARVIALSGKIYRNKTHDTAAFIRTGWRGVTRSDICLLCRTKLSLVSLIQDAPYRRNTIVPVSRINALNHSLKKLRFFRRVHNSVPIYTSLHRSCRALASGLFSKSSRVSLCQTYFIQSNNSNLRHILIKFVNLSRTERRIK